MYSVNQNRNSKEQKYYDVYKTFFFESAMKSFLIFLTGGDGDVDTQVAVVGKQLCDGRVENL